jgi:hypothetical protein
LGRSATKKDIQENQKVSVQLPITIQLSGEQRLSDHSVCVCIYIYIYIYIVKANWIRHILRRNSLLQRVTEGKIQGGIEVIGRQGRRRRKLLDDLNPYPANVEYRVSSQ